MPSYRPLIRLSQLHPTPLPYWRRIGPESGLIDRIQIRDWTLVLNARGIYWQLCNKGRRHFLYVSPLQEEIARSELIAYISDNSPPKTGASSTPRLYPYWLLGPFYLLPLILVYELPHYQSLQALGSLDNIKISLHHEWWRYITALTLHNGTSHLVDNLFFGAIFLAILARLAGAGVAWLLTCLGGISGNILSAAIHTLGYISVGFSTALFATVGAIGALLIWRSSENFLMPVAASLALLALLGTNGVQTDYGAHICGLMGGAGIGLLYRLLLHKGCLILPQWLAALLSLGLPVFAWLSALDKF